MANDQKPLTIFTKNSIIDVGLGSKYASAFGRFQIFGVIYCRIKEINEVKQKQPPQVLCKKRCSYKFHKFHGKTPVLESLFNKVSILK